MKKTVTTQNWSKNQDAIMKRGRNKFDPSTKITEPQHAKTIREQVEMLNAGKTLQGQALKGVYIGTSEIARDPRSLDFTEIQARREFLAERQKEIGNHVRSAAQQIKQYDRQAAERTKKADIDAKKAKYFTKATKSADD